MGITINEFEAENVKRIRAVKLHPSPTGLTIIGGNNGQGKTSVLDSIAWALGGEKFRPTDAKNKDSVIPPYLHVTLSNGLVVERNGKNSSLKVTDPSGEKAGQKLLDSFIGTLALDLPKFMNASNTEKAKILLNILGVGDQLEELNNQERKIYDERTAIGRIADQKEKYAKEQPYYSDVPEAPISSADLIKQQQEILARNGQRQQWIRDYDKYQAEYNSIVEQIDLLKERLHEVDEKVKASKHSPRELQMESTEELEASLANIEETNRKVRANLDKEKAEDDARQYRRQYDQLTDQIESIRNEKKSLLDHADLPLEGLCVENGNLIYNGEQWDCMSSSDQLKVATAIVKKLNPECGFVLIDKLEQMDMKTLKEFGDWLEREGLQVIATRVSTGDECSIIIEDGFGDDKKAGKAVQKKKWEAGKF
jgi:chromosome segregation ATPase